VVRERIAANLRCARETARKNSIAHVREPNSRLRHHLHSRRSFSLHPATGLGSTGGANVGRRKVMFPRRLAALANERAGPRLIDVREGTGRARSNTWFPPARARASLPRGRSSPRPAVLAVSARRVPEVNREGESPRPATKTWALALRHRRGPPKGTYFSRRKATTRCRRPANQIDNDTNQRTSPPWMSSPPPEPSTGPHRARAAREPEHGQFD